MSWIRDNTLSWIQMLCVKVVKTGRVPRHIAFIMDGNRRFAKKNKVEKGEGHSKGFDKLAETLQWCLDLGIPEVTVYAFSIENFKRSQEEVDTLMSLAREKFQRLLDEKDLLMEREVCVRIVGRLSLLPPDIRALIAEAMLLTKDNTKARLNVAFAYTGRDEITGVIQDIVKGAQEGIINSPDVTEALMNESMQLSAPELLVRTSGEVRLSDFMLWQLTDTCLYFTDVLWPEFKIWHLLASIIHFQRTTGSAKEGKLPINENGWNFLNYLKDQRLHSLETYVQATQAS